MHKVYFKVKILVCPIKAVAYGKTLILKLTQKLKNKQKKTQKMTILTLLIFIPIIASIYIAVIPYYSYSNWLKNTSPSFLDQYAPNFKKWFIVSSLNAILANVFQSFNKVSNSPKGDLVKTRGDSLKLIALTASFINLFLSVILWIQFDGNSFEYQFVSEYSTSLGSSVLSSDSNLNSFHFNFGVDGISIYFVLLTTFITPIALLSNLKNIKVNLPNLNVTPDILKKILPMYYLSQFFEYIKTSESKTRIDALPRYTLKDQGAEKTLKSFVVSSDNPSVAPLISKHLPIRKFYMKGQGGSSYLTSINYRNYLEGALVREDSPCGFHSYEVYKYFPDLFRPEISPCGFHSYETFDIFPNIKQNSPCGWDFSEMFDIFPYMFNPLSLTHNVSFHYNKIEARNKGLMWKCSGYMFSSSYVPNYLSVDEICPLNESISPSGFHSHEVYRLFPHLFVSTPSGFTNFEWFNLFGNSFIKRKSPCGFHSYELHQIFPELKGSSLVKYDTDYELLGFKLNTRTQNDINSNLTGTSPSGFNADELLKIFPFSVLSTMPGINKSSTISKFNEWLNFSGIKTSSVNGGKSIENMITSKYNPFNSTLNFGPGLKIFLISILLLESLQICAFVSLDLLMFYIFFESILPIVFVLIIIFGHGDDRIRSAMLFFLFTLAGSLPMLLSILTIYSYVGSTDFTLIGLNEISLESQKVLWIGFFIAFAVKTPLMPFSIWLPKAHSDSPLAGSIFLAGTMLKLATYGYLRVLINFLPDATNYFSPFVQSIAIFTLVFASFATIIQQDSKKLVAYSSIAHMSCCILGLFSNNIQGIEGAILLSIAHGFVSPALFICVGGVIYDRAHTRVIPYIRGLATFMPIFTIYFFIFTLANSGIPLTLNFLGEQLALIGIFMRNPFAAVIGASGIVLSAVYSLYMYNRMSYGAYSKYMKPYNDLSIREFYLLFVLLVPTVVLGIFPNIVIDSIHVSVSTLIYNIPSV